jgi:hypothetical protein
MEKYNTESCSSNSYPLNPHKIGQRFERAFWNMDILYRFQELPALDQIRSAHTLTLHFFKNIFNIILPIPVSPKRSLTFTFSNYG